MTRSSSMPPMTVTAPNPDPTLRTMELVDKAMLQLEDRIEIRIDAIEKAIALQHEDSVRVPTEIQRATSGLRELMEAKMASIGQLMQEQFDGVHAKFTERDRRFDLRDVDSKLAVDAALTATKENTAKLEGFFTKQIDQISVIMNNANEAVNGKVNDVKERLTAIEARGGGRNDMWGWMVGIVGIAIAIAALVIPLSRNMH